MTTKKSYMILIISFFIATGQLLAQNSVEDLAGLLQKIKTYEYGQSRENLTAINNLLREFDDSDNNMSEVEEILTKFLESGASLPSMRFICECLSIYGTERSVSILEELLLQSETEAMALFALERNPSDKATEVLVDALSDVSDKSKVGIINALGNRREPEAIEDIISHISDKKSEIAIAAISASGKIGGDQAVEALSDALSDADYKYKNEIINALLICGEGFQINNQNPKALAVYQSLTKQEYDDQVRYAAYRGIIQTSKQDVSEIILNALENEGPNNSAVVIPLISKIPESEDITPIVDKVSEMKPEYQVIALAALAGRNDPAVEKMMVKATGNENGQIRMAAIESLSLSGDKKTAILLAEIASSRKGAEKITAQTSLSRLNAPGTDRYIINKIPETDDPVRIELIRSTSTRRIASASPILIYQLENPNQKVRIASIKSLKDIGTDNELNPLIIHHKKAVNSQELKELENTIVAILKRSEMRQSRSSLLIANMKDVEDIKLKSSYLEMIGRLGDPDGLIVLEDALKSDITDIKSSALRGLSKWPNSKPSDQLLQIAKTSDNNVHRVLALRGFVSVVDIDTSTDNEKKLSMYKEAMILADNPADKRLVLSAVANAPTVDAFRYVSSLLDDQDVKGEAEIAVVKIVRGIDERPREEILTVLQKVESQTQNEELLERVQDILHYIEENTE